MIPSVIQTLKASDENATFAWIKSKKCKNVEIVCSIYLSRLLKYRRQISLPLLSEFKRMNQILFAQKQSENLWFSGFFKGG